MDINEGTEASATVYTNQASSAINTYLSGWVTDSTRKAGDITCMEVPSTVKDENGNAMADLIFCGHTLGGQVNLFGKCLMTAAGAYNGDFPAGLYLGPNRHENRTGG